MEEMKLHHYNNKLERCNKIISKKDCELKTVIAENENLIGDLKGLFEKFKDLK